MNRPATEHLTVSLVPNLPVPVAHTEQTLAGCKYTSIQRSRVVILGRRSYERQRQPAGENDLWASKMPANSRSMQTDTRYQLEKDDVLYLLLLYVAWGALFHKVAARMIDRNGQRSRKHRAFRRVYDVDQADAVYRRWAVSQRRSVKQVQDAQQCAARCKAIF